MVRKDLLEKELKRYKNQELKPVNFSIDFINNLFKRYKDYGMTENSYCCYGEERCCWQEVVEEGVWELTLEKVKEDIIRSLKYVKKYLYNKSQYGKRFYVYQSENCCEIFIYTRDLVKTDYMIYFNNK